MRQDEGWALFTPSGTAIAATFATEKSQAEQNAYDWLQCKKWAQASRFWKQWDDFVKERTKRGWDVAKVVVLYVGDI